MQVYKHSGAVPPAGAVQSLIAGSLAAIALGVVYCFTFYYVPYVYLNFVMAVAVGAGTGYVVGQTAIHGKIRNERAVAAIALVAALAGIYAEWGTTLYALYPTAELPQLWAKAGLKPFLPQSVLVLMLQLFAKGSWGLTEHATVHGWPLVALWLVEAGMILMAAVGLATSRMAHRPFCEGCQEWIGALPPHSYVGDGWEPVWTEVQHGAFENLAFTPRAFGNEQSYVRLLLRVCDGCSDSNYLTITACHKTIDSKGRPRLEEKNLVTNLRLTQTQVEIVQAANMIAPKVGELPLRLPAADWTVQNEPPFAAAPSQAVPTTGASS